MNVKFKKLSPEAVIPSYAQSGDAGLDLTAISINKDMFPLYIEYGTGLALELPEKTVGLIFPRSSISKTSLGLRNAVGVIDQGYRGEIKLRFGLDNGENILYDLYSKIGQLVIMNLPEINIIETKTLSKSDRSTGGFGSTGK